MFDRVVSVLIWPYYALRASISRWFYDNGPIPQHFAGLDYKSYCYMLNALNSLEQGSDLSKMNLLKLECYMMRWCDWDTMKRIVDLAASSSEFTILSNLMHKIPSVLFSDQRYIKDSLLLRTCIIKSGIDSGAPLPIPDSQDVRDKVAALIDRCIAMPENITKQFDPSVQVKFIEATVGLDDQALCKLTKNLSLVPGNFVARYGFGDKCQEMLLKAAMPSNSGDFAPFITIITRIKDQIPYIIFSHANNKLKKLLINFAMTDTEKCFSQFVANVGKIVDIFPKFGSSAQYTLVKEAFGNFGDNFSQISENLHKLFCAQFGSKVADLKDNDQSCLIDLACKANSARYEEMIRNLNAIPNEIWKYFAKINDGFVSYAANAYAKDFDIFIAKLISVPRHVLEQGDEQSNAELFKYACGNSSYQFDILVSKLGSIPSDLSKCFASHDPSFWGKVIEFALARNSEEFQRLLKDLEQIDSTKLRLLNIPRHEILKAAFTHHKAFCKVVEKYEDAAKEKVERVAEALREQNFKVEIRYGDKKISSAEEAARINKLLQLPVVKKFNQGTMMAIKKQTVCMSGTEFDAFKARIDMLSKLGNLDHHTAEVLVKSILDLPVNLFETLWKQLCTIDEKSREHSFNERVRCELLKAVCKNKFDAINQCFGMLDGPENVSEYLKAQIAERLLHVVINLDYCNYDGVIKAFQEYLSGIGVSQPQGPLYDAPPPPYKAPPSYEESQAQHSAAADTNPQPPSYEEGPQQPLHSDGQQEGDYHI